MALLTIGSKCLRTYICPGSLFTYWDLHSTASLFSTVSGWLQGPTAKETDSTKESVRRERLTVIAKRAVQAAQAAVMQHKKPTSSVEADITGGSTLSGQAFPRQEMSTATSKSYTFKAGVVAYVLFSVLLLCHLCVAEQALL